MTHDLDRRNLLAWTAGAVTLVLADGTVRAAGTIPPLPEGDAYSPWQLWNAPALRNTPLALVSAALLAANPHDTQPWLFRVTADSIEIFADASRNLGAMDAVLREMHLGLGCAIENAVIAAGPNGYVVEVKAMPGALTAIADRRSPIHAATLHLAKRAMPTAPDALYRAIPERHTNRHAYDRAAPLPPAWTEFALHATVDDEVRVFLYRDGPPRVAFDACVVEATEAIIADAVMIADSDRWFRGSQSEIETHRDGPTIDAAGLSPFMTLLAKVLPASAGTVHQAWLNQTRDTQVASAALCGLIAVRNRYDRPMALAAGRSWQRLHLYAAVNGVALQPLNQPLEMIDREKQRGTHARWDARVAALTETSEWQATFAFRAGIATEAAPPSPRRRLQDVLMG